ncbi:Fc.00g038860.m01.CDS01 [Cosmosporella sp. VM-42]
MCTGTRKLYICLCKRVDCPRRFSLDINIGRPGHALKEERDEWKYDKCLNWISKGPPEDVLNRRKKPDCEDFEWTEILIPLGVCGPCQKECQKKGEKNAGGGGSGIGNWI